MRMIVDTSAWSLALRRKNPHSNAARQLAGFIGSGEDIHLLGVIVQELLSGITDKRLFRRLETHLEAFPLVDLGRQDYVEAAKLANTCRERGIVAGAIDYLIASVCVTRDFLLFTTDKDFERIAGVCKLKVVD